MNNIISDYYNKIQIKFNKKKDSLILDLNKIYLNTLLYKSLNMTILTIEDDKTDSWNYYKDMNYL